MEEGDTKEGRFVAALAEQGHDPDSRRRLAFVLEYDGTRYKGFQWQSNAPSVQGEVEKAIRSFTGETTRVRAASRTDAGVHARGQVVDFLTQAGYAIGTFTNALNWYLPPDIRVRGTWEAPLSFNSRREAVSRVYRYTLFNAKWPPAILRQVCHWVRSPLDVARMTEAGGWLPGTRDVPPFTWSLPPGRSPVRCVKRWDVWRGEGLVQIEAEGNGFLPHQVRRTNGLLVEVGLGKLGTDVIKGIIYGTIRELRCWPSVPARGLCLMSVRYAKVLCPEGKGYEAEA